MLTIQYKMIQNYELPILQIVQDAKILSIFFKLYQVVELDQALPGGRARMQIDQALPHGRARKHCKALPYDRARMLSSLALVCHEVKMLESVALVVEL